MNGSVGAKFHTFFFVVKIDLFFIEKFLTATMPLKKKYMSSIDCFGAINFLITN